VAVKTVTEYICDRCKGKSSVHDLITLEWYELFSRKQRKDLCSKCMRKLISFLENKHV
jgi:hypothetical protein